MKKISYAKPFLIEMVFVLFILTVVCTVLVKLYSVEVEKTITDTEKNNAMIEVKNAAEIISSKNNPEEISKYIGAKNASGVYEKSYNKNFNADSKSVSYKMVTTLVNENPDYPKLMTVKIDFYKVNNKAEAKVFEIETKKFETE